MHKRFFAALLLILALLSANASSAADSLLCELVALAPAAKLVEDYRNEKIQMLKTKAERAPYELTLRDGQIFGADGKLFDTRAGVAIDEQGEDRRTGRAIFVVSLDGKLYASTRHEVGTFHHSTFVNGEPVLLAGELTVHDGKLVLISHKSGHYRPGPYRLKLFADLLARNGFDLSKLVVRLVGTEHSAWGRDFDIDFKTFGDGVSKESQDNDGVLLKLVGESESPPLDIVFYLLFHRPQNMATAPRFYPASYSPVLFKGLTRLVLNPNTRARTLLELEGAGHFKTYMRESPELDQTLRELMRELPEARELDHLLDERRHAGVLSQ